VLLLTPLLYFGSYAGEYVRAARALGIRTLLGVGSWDHLTTKGLIHEAPDRVVVWNEAQRIEAGELHGIAPDRVTVTGAQAYDHWFVQKPTLSREAFQREGGNPRRSTVAPVPVLVALHHSASRSPSSGAGSMPFARATRPSCGRRRS
jgi:hypothetical protein